MMDILAPLFVQCVSTAFLSKVSKVGHGRRLGEDERTEKVSGGLKDGGDRRVRAEGMCEWREGRG